MTIVTKITRRRATGAHTDFEKAPSVRKARTSRSGAAAEAAEEIIRHEWVEGSQREKAN